MLGVNLGWTSIPSRGGGGMEEILLAASCYRNQDNLLSDGPVGLEADFTFTYLPNSENCFKMES